MKTKNTLHLRPHDQDATISSKLIEVANLRPHPLNRSLYGNAPDEVFIADIRSNGVLTPLIVTSDNHIVSGHRRYQAAVKLKLKTGYYMRLLL